MTNNPILIKKSISQIKSLTSKQITEIIKKADIEESINLLEEKIEFLNRHLQSYENKDCKTSVYEELKKEKEALENVINRLKEDEEVMNEMSETLTGLTIWNDSEEETLILGDKGEVIEYFREEVRNERNKI